LNKYKMGHLEGNFTPVLYMWDARFLKVDMRDQVSHPHYTTDETSVAI
jgi:hypothetical protein